MDILPDGPEDDGIAYLSFFVEEKEDGSLEVAGEKTRQAARQLRQQRQQAGKAAEKYAATQEISYPTPEDVLPTAEGGAKKSRRRRKKAVPAQQSPTPAAPVAPAEPTPPIHRSTDRKSVV